MADTAHASPPSDGDENARLTTILENSASNVAQPLDTRDEKRPFQGSQYASASHVNIDTFDPEGVRDLQRTLSVSEEPGPSVQHRTSTEKRSVSVSERSVDTDATLFGPLPEPFDFEKFFRKVLKRRDEANIPVREVGVAFSDLRVVGVGATASYQETLGSLLNPLNIIANIQQLRHPALHDILSGFEGVVRPGEMLLVLGRPGSGCTTLLKALSNQWEEYHKVEGEVNFDSLTPAEIAKHYRGDVQYCPEDDIHFPTLTVGQTLTFAAKTRVPQSRFDDISRQDFIDKIVDVLTTVFGLRHVRDTPVGDASIRGVSGGEKKRVSITEALATRSLLQAWDNSTRGLDASTALEFVEALRIATDLGRVSTIVSIYQAGESLYKLFNKVCVIYEGKMAYFGPADRARQYFIDMGYEPANRQTTADFLVSVTDSNARIPRAGITGQPRTADEFAAYFQQSQDAQTNAKDIAAYRAEFVGKAHRASAYLESARGEHARHTRPSSPYITSVPMQVRAVMLRRVQIIKGGMALQIVNLASFVLQGIIVGTVFFRTPDATSAYFSRGGVLYFALLFTALSSLAEIPALFSQRPIVARHKKAALYHPFIESVALTLVDMPISFVIILIFCIILYFLVRLQQTAGQFFIFFLFVFSMAQVMKAFFRFLAASFESSASAQAFAGITLLILVLYTGYTIPKPSMIGALRWLTYINPLRYGFESLITNEFHTLDGVCSNLVPSGPSYADVSLANKVCTTVGSVPGQMDVSGSAYVAISYGYYQKDLWRNFGITVVFGIGFLVLLLAFTEFKTSTAGHRPLITLFKRGSKAVVVQEAKAAASGDEEKVPETASGSQSAPSKDEAEEAMKSQQEMTDVFSWQHLNYSVPVHGGEIRQLLNDVSGFVAPGKLTALMGESGAGKTTLLNALAERTTTGVVTGDRFVNGHTLPKDFQRQTGYCQQQDTHLPTATVREALLFSAKLRQPASVPLVEKEAYVETVLKMCGLEAYGDAIVGTLGIENRKRTTIAVELAAKPKLLLFLDEPTSGLDSQSAWGIVTFLRSLADHGQAILCTIHQPSAELFQSFDRLLLLKKGGKTVYFGDIGRNADTLIHYFENHGSRRCDPDENPAEFILQVIGAGATATVQEDWHAIWNGSDEAKAVQAELNRIHEEGRKRPAVQEADRREYAASWIYQVAELSKRDAADHWRNPTYLVAKITLSILGGLLIGFTFFKAKDTLQGTQNKVFAVFMGTILSVPLGNQLQLPFIEMRSIYEIRERPSRTYSWTALITSQILVEIPWNILGTTLFFLCWYWTVGFETERAGYTYLFLGVVFPIYYSTIAQAIAAVSPSADIAAILFSFLFNFVITFNGVLQPFKLLGWWQWMYHVTPYTYLISGLVGQAIGEQEIACSDVEYVMLNPPSGQSCGNYLQQYISEAGGYLVNPDATSACQFCADRTTDQFLIPNFNILYSQHWRNLGIFCAFTAFNIFAVYLLTYLFRIKGSAIGGGIKNIFRRRKN